MWLRRIIFGLSIIPAGRKRENFGRRRQLGALGEIRLLAAIADRVHHPSDTTPSFFRPLSDRTCKFLDFSRFSADLIGVSSSKYLAVDVTGSRGPAFPIILAIARLNDLIVSAVSAGHEPMLTPPKMFGYYPAATHSSGGGE
jgi:hypothetical protein